MSEPERVLSGRYRVDSLIGRGGMAYVYRGYDLTLDRVVAIKILQRDLASDNAFRLRFRMEAQAASRMSHPNIVRVFDAGEDTVTQLDGSQAPVPYIVMELVEGTLLKSIAAAGPIPESDAQRYVSGILDALEYSHRAGVVHRDIKPGNVMITRDGSVKVMDFGIARAVSDSSSTVAQTTTILGTASYFSPEQAKGEPADARADLYSTGVVLYELLTGRTPFRGESPVAVAYQHVSEQPVPPSERNPALSRGADVVVLRALAKSPNARYQNAAEFRAALLEINGPVSERDLAQINEDLFASSRNENLQTARSLQQLSDTAPSKRTQSGPPTAWVWAGVALVAVVLVSLFIWVISMRPQEPVEVPVPEVSGMSFERAFELLTADGFVAVEAKEHSDTVAEGITIRSDPEAGVPLLPGEKVTVFVSEGADLALVPELSGMSEAEAILALEERDLRLGEVSNRDNPDLAAGVVISSSPGAGSEVSPGSVVNLVVASGRVTINDYRGYTIDAATRELQALNLVVETQGDASCVATDPAQVNWQSSPPGDVPIKSSVTLSYCTGE